MEEGGADCQSLKSIGDSLFDCTVNRQAAVVRLSARGGIVPRIARLKKGAMGGLFDRSKSVAEKTLLGKPAVAPDSRMVLVFQWAANGPLVPVVGESPLWEV